MAANAPDGGAVLRVSFGPPARSRKASEQPAGARIGGSIERWLLLSTSDPHTALPLDGTLELAAVRVV